MTCWKQRYAVLTAQGCLQPWAASRSGVRPLAARRLATWCFVLALDAWPCFGHSVQCLWYGSSTACPGAKPAGCMLTLSPLSPCAPSPICRQTSWPDLTITLHTTPPSRSTYQPWEEHSHWKTLIHNIGGFYFPIPRGAVSIGISCGKVHLAHWSAMRLSDTQGVYLPITTQQWFVSWLAFCIVPALVDLWFDASAIARLYTCRHGQPFMTASGPVWQWIVKYTAGQVMTTSFGSIHGFYKLLHYRDWTGDSLC